PNERPLVSPSPQGTQGGTTPDDGPPPSVGAAGSSRPDRSATSGDKDTGGGTAKPGSDSGEPGARSGRGWKQIVAACRDLRNGKDLDGDRRRMLEDAAGNSSRVGRYCKGVLATADLGAKLREGTDQDTRERAGDGDREDDDGGDADKDGDKRGTKPGKHRGDKRGGHGRHGDRDRHGHHQRADRDGTRDGGKGSAGRSVGHARHSGVTSAAAADRLTQPSAPYFPALQPL
ncbi:hypothetical protein N4P33_11085, partial [Streptomyces sp. 15-116A]|nr:hypothetical protein [Streptomyces sp. 15-116A]